MTRLNTVLESHVEKTVTAYARKLGWLSYKFSSPSVRGVPDRIYMRDGEIFFIEFKREGKKPTKLQLHTHKQIQEQGGIEVFIIDDVEQGKKLIDTLSEYEE